MIRGKNPHRPKEALARHNSMVKHVANTLYSCGFDVLADHIGWPAGSPREINGYIPDVVASRNKQPFIFEIETCTTLCDSFTMEQLSAFSKAGSTCVVVPPICSRRAGPCDTVPYVQSCLQTWNLPQVKIGTCNPSTGEFNCRMMSSTRPDG